MKLKEFIKETLVAINHGLKEGCEASSKDYQFILQDDDIPIDFEVSIDSGNNVGGQHKIKFTVPLSLFSSNDD